MIIDLTKYDIEAEIAKFDSVKMRGNRVLISPFQLPEIYELRDYLEIGLVVNIGSTTYCKVGDWITYDLTEEGSSLIVNGHLAIMTSTMYINIIKIKSEK
jgi:hypothetical protein